MWETHQLSKQLRCRPSDLFEIEGDFTRYCFDRAVTIHGLALEARVKKVTAKVKKQEEAERKATSEVIRWTSSADPEAKPSGRFRDPMGMVGR